MVNFRGRTTYKKYEPSKPIKCGFRSFILAEYLSFFTYSMRVLESTEEDDKNKIYSLVSYLIDDLNEYNHNIKHILATDGLYSSEEICDNPYFYFICSIRPNRIKAKKEFRKRGITSEIDPYNYKYFYKKGKNNIMILTLFHDNKQFYIINNYVNPSFKKK